METSAAKTCSLQKRLLRESWECTQIFMTSEMRKQCPYEIMGNWLNCDRPTGRGFVLPLTVMCVVDLKDVRKCSEVEDSQLNMCLFLMSLTVS